MTTKTRFAIPTFNKKLTAHFGHCKEFAIVDMENEQVKSAEYITPPAHEPGSYPQFLADNKVDIIITGGLGMKAQQIFQQHNIRVIMGAPEKSPEELVQDYLSDKLESGVNLCDH